jgi:hypothetical protein
MKFMRSHSFGPKLNRRPFENSLADKVASTSRRLAGLTTAAVCLLFSVAVLRADDDNPNSPTQQILPNPVITASTVPANGDVNPYGVAFVPQGYPAGFMQPDDILVSNFNNKQNLQGTGSTIVRFDKNGKPSLFFNANRKGVGLSTALNISKLGPIFVGNFPTSDGTCATAQPGSIFVINRVGHLFEVLQDVNYVNGPWDSTLFDRGDIAQLFVSNALDGTVSRLDLAVSANSVRVIGKHHIASGYMHRCDPAALVVAPTGLVYHPTTDTLFVASTEDNAVFAVPYAGTATSDQGKGHIIYEDPKHLHGALAMTAAPNGHLLVTNSDVINSDPKQPSEIVEFTKTGKFVAQMPVDPAQGGSFGLGFGHVIGDSAVRFAAVDDNTATLTIWKLNFDDPK